MTEKKYNMFGEEGYPVKVEGNSPLLLSDTENFWIVDSGIVDVFVVRIENGKPAGSRTNFFRAVEGDILFGMNFERYGRGFGLIACGVTGTRLLRFRMSRLVEMAKEPARREEVSSLIDNWITGLSSGLCRGMMPPKQFMGFESGGEVLTEENVSVHAEKGGVVWVKQLAGTSQFMGREQLSITAADGLTPISNHTWLQSVDKGKLHIVDTKTLIEKDPSWPDNLENFYSMVMNCLVLNKEEAEEEERERFRNRAEHDRLNVGNALSQLASKFKTSRAKTAVSEEKDALFQACSLVGDALGVTIKQHPDIKKGKELRDPLGAIALVSRIRLRKVILRDDWWRRDNGPLLAFMKETNRPVALIPLSSNHYEVHDTVEGTTIRVTAEVASALDGIACTFYRPFPEGRLNVMSLFKLGLHGCRKDIIMIVLMGILGGLLGLLPPIATGMIFGEIIPGAERNQLFQIALILLSTSLAIAVFSLTGAIATLRLEGKMDSSVQSGVWDRLMSLPASFFHNYSAGDLAERAMGISEIRMILSGTVLQSLMSSIFSLFSLALLFYYSWRLALVAIGLVFMGLIFTGVCGLFQLRHERGLARIQGKIAGVILQLINGISKLHVAGAENRGFTMWSKEFGEQKKARFKAESITNMVATFNSMFPVVCSMAIFFMVIRLNAGAMGSGSAVITTGNFLAFNAAFGTYLAAMLGMTANLTSALNVIPLYERAKPILQTLPEVDAAKSDPGELSGGIEVNDVYFSYTEDGPVILKDVSLQIRPGELVALVGPSGSGKSTLFRLLLGFETPSSGTIYYDGQDIAGLDIGAVRRQLGVVLQNSDVMAGDIYGNIVGASPLTRDEAWEAACLAGFDEDIKQMPMGMDTALNYGGTTLSGGQRQRLLIARAIANKPRVVYFDEATSALDNKTQAIVSRSLETLEVTRVVIAHRLSTIRNADRIYLLKDGVLAESGTYDELMEQGGAFAELARRQLA